MSQRTKKVASLIQQIVAAELQSQLGMAEITVTTVDVSPDLRQATVWLGIISTQSQKLSPDELFRRAESLRPRLQDAVARQLTTKFVPRLSLRPDLSGEYAQHIGRVMNNL